MSEMKENDPARKRSENSDAQKRASAKYKRFHVKTFQLKFYPKDHDAYEFVKAKDSTNGYIMNLIHDDMEREDSFEYVKIDIPDE